MALENSYERNLYGFYSEEKPYLKCSYGEGMHPSEYVATFKTINSKPNESPLFVGVGREICINPKALESVVTVDKGTIIPIKGSDKGLLKIFDIFSDNGTKSLIQIPDKDNGGTVRKYVPNSEIIWI